LENVEGMDNFLDTHELPRLNLEDRKNINISVSIHEIEAASNTHLSKESTQGMHLVLNSTRILGNK
jgi:hypothetical protein